MLNYIVINIFYKWLKYFKFKIILLLLIIDIETEIIFLIPKNINVEDIYFY